MSLAALIARLGLAEVARRAGVTVATVRNWARNGPSRAGEEAIRRIVAAHNRAAKSAATKASKFRAAVPTPEDAGLPDEDVKPGKAPTYAEKRRAILGAKTMGSTIATPKRDRRYASDRYQTDRYHGERTWVHYGKSLVDVSVEDIIETAETIWFKSGRQWCQVTLLIFRFIPFNPAYSPNHHLFRKQGTWLEQWESTPHIAPAREWSRSREVLASAIWYLFGPGLSREWGPTMGLHAQAETRVLWLESACVKTFDTNEGFGHKPMRKGR